MSPVGSAMTPQQSLQVLVSNNPVAPGGDWASDIVNSNLSPQSIITSLTNIAIWHNRGHQFPICAREWTQVPDPGNDYDTDAVALSGWMLQPEISGNDLQFTHPFGNDWECMVAVDDAFTGLLAAGNFQPDGSDGQEAVNAAAGLSIPVPDEGLLAIETDSECVPSGLNPSISLPNIVVGDRIAALGRWIVDTGHRVDGLVNNISSYRAEVHPPLLMVIGGTRTDQNGLLTRVYLTSRPYLVKQVFTTDTSTIYQDSGSNDGAFLEHIDNELNKLSGIIPSSLSIEIHPKVSEKPFDGIFNLKVRVRPPVRGHVPVVYQEVIVARYQFTHKGGVAVQVIDADDGVDLDIVLNSVNYTAPPLPTRHDRIITKSDLGDYSELISLEQWTALLDGLIGTVVAEHALAEGITTDQYMVPDVDILDSSNAIPFTPIGNIAAAGQQGIVENDAQPYPIYGFLEIRWQETGPIVDPPPVVDPPIVDPRPVVGPIVDPPPVVGPPIVDPRPVVGPIVDPPPVVGPPIVHPVHPVA